MARILYFSTHEPLEYDDVRLFIDMGHIVFPIGKYCPAEPQTLQYRAEIDFPEATCDLVLLFQSEGCRNAFMDLSIVNLTAAFLNSFDFIISVQDLGFIDKFWALIDGPVVIWRTVGQAIDHFDARAQPYRAKGMKIVRWSDREQFADVYIGHDAIIRAYKNPDEYGPWNGSSGNIITFSNSYLQRYPIEYGLFQRVVRLLPYAIGGLGNDGLPGAMGMLSSDTMKTTMASAAAYFYMHGSVVPYSLNFIEAMMSGIPIVAASRNVQITNIDMKYNEINDFIVHGYNGLLFKSEQEAKGILMSLLLDRDFAAAIGANGRRTAIRLFGKERAMADWKIFFDAHYRR